MRVRFSINLELGPADPEPEREGSADSVTERADPHQPPLGFAPPKEPSPAAHPED